MIASVDHRCPMAVRRDRATKIVLIIALIQYIDRLESYRSSFVDQRPQLEAEVSVSYHDCDVSMARIVTTLP